MEIIKKVSSKFMFRCLKTFQWGSHPTKVGEEIELKEPEATSMVKFRKVVPVDLPEIGEYISVAPFSLPGRAEKFTCEKLERVQIKASDAIPLMLERSIIPADPDRWRPYGMKLRQKPDDSHRKRAAMEKTALDSKLFEIGIHPAQTKK